ncbi:hypothetical protein ACFQ4C_20190 [Larkinella insperata]|uniref:PKD-like domain-containing protein n=1 Tax=Larkinella insperata TaxID=332158 RepID=A0ABW3QB22_9BACT|nr:hypothetical protein [Larkinella insperata]
MEKNASPLLALVYGVFFFSTCLSQAQVSITGDPCVGATLTLQAGSGVPKRIDWYLGNTLLQVNSTWQAEGVVVTGGNGSNLSPIALDVFVDHQKNIYVLEDGSQRVQKWVPGATAGVTVAGGNGKGSEMNQFFSPSSIWVDESGSVYVVDYAKNRVQKWAPGATVGVTVAGGNGEGSAANQFSGPRAICMDKAGNMYIADRWNHRVQKWAPGATTGQTVAGGNGKGSGDNQFYEPMDIGIDHKGNLYVIDQFNNRVQKWAPGATTGQTVIGKMGKGKTASQSDFFSAISVDSEGNIYVVDRGNYRVQRWSPNASYGITVAGGNGFGAAPNQIRSTFGLWADNSGNVYVADLVGNGIRRFGRQSQATSTFLTYRSGVHKAVVTLEGSATQVVANHQVDTIPRRPQSITGPFNVIAGQKNLAYSVKNSAPGDKYDWVVPGDATITAGQGTAQITVNWGLYSGGVGVVAHNHCGAAPMRAMSVVVNPPPATGNYEGFLDKVECGTIRGWVWDSKQPNTPLPVEFSADGIVIGSTLANIYRQDIKAAGKGNGEHVYNFRTPEHIKDGKSHSISARVLGTSYVLKWAPKTVECPSPFRLSQSETANDADWSAVLLGNPISSGEVDVELKNAQGQTLSLEVIDAQGQLLKKITPVQPTSNLERFRLSLDHRSNEILLLRIVTSTKSKTLKLTTKD